MKRALKRRIGQGIWLYLPYGVCLVGKLQRWDNEGNFRVSFPGHYDCAATFKVHDVVAVNAGTGDAFWLRGSSPPAFPHIKRTPALQKWLDLGLPAHSFQSL